MRTTVLVFGKSRESLRKRILTDLTEGRKKEFQVLQGKQPGRSPGWAKIRREKGVGTINFRWDGEERLLTCWAVTKGKNRPASVVADFIRYILQRHGTQIATILVKIK